MKRWTCLCPMCGDTGRLPNDRMIHAELIAALEGQGMPVSPFMNYWTLDELVRYYEKHTHENLP